MAQGHILALCMNVTCIVFTILGISHFGFLFLSLLSLDICRNNKIIFKQKQYVKMRVELNVTWGKHSKALQSDILLGHPRQHTATPEALLAACSFLHSASLAIVHAIHITGPSRVNIIFIGSRGAPSQVLCRGQNPHDPPG